MKKVTVFTPNFIRLNLRLLLAVAVLSGFSTLAGIDAAQAAKDCNIFAAAAVTRARENIKYNCGFTDTRFADDQAGHFNWCANAAVTEQQVLNELNYRLGKINKCKAKYASLENSCKVFAQQAVEKAKQNIQLNCGYTTGNYANDYNGHYQWCLNNGVQQASHADSVTNLGISECKAKKASADARVLACRNFAEAAELKAIENRDRNCGYTTGAYAIDYKGHYQWCLSATDAAVVAANRATNAGIDACRAKQQ